MHNSIFPYDVDPRTDRSDAGMGQEGVEVLELNDVVEREEEGWVPVAFKESGGKEAEVGDGECDGGMAEVGEVRGVEEAGPMATDEG